MRKLWAVRSDYLLPVVVLFLSVISSGLTVFAACANNGARNVGCGSGENQCSGGTQAICTADTAKILASGIFGCGTVTGRENCESSVKDKALCYTEYSTCTWDANRSPKCLQDNDSADPHNDWIKIDFACGS
jgi:hypothetical protein